MLHSTHSFKLHQVCSLTSPRQVVRDYNVNLQNGQILLATLHCLQLLRTMSEYGDVSKGEPGLTCIGGVLRNSNGDVLYMFSKHVGVYEANEAEVLAILEVLRCFS